MIKGDELAIKLASISDVGTVVIVAGDNLKRTMVHVLAGSTDNSKDMVACNGGLPKSHDGAHDCQVPNALFVVIQLAEDAVGGDFEFHEIQIFQEREIGRNNAAIATNGIA